MSAVSKSFACPSWSADERADKPAPSIKVATVLPKLWLVTPSKPAALERLAHHLQGLAGSRMPPATGAGKAWRAGSSSLTSSGWAPRSMITAYDGHSRMRRSSRALRGGLDNEAAGTEKARRGCALLSGCAFGSEIIAWLEPPKIRSEKGG